MRPNIRFLAVYLPLPLLIREHVVSNLRVVYNQKYLAGMSFHPALSCSSLLLPLYFVLRSRPDSAPHCFHRDHRRD